MNYKKQLKLQFDRVNERKKALVDWQLIFKLFPKASICKLN